MRVNPLAAKHHAGRANGDVAVAEPKSKHKHRDAKAEAGESFQAGRTTAETTRPLRPAQSAVTFIKRFEQGLHLSPESRAARLDYMKSSELAMFRANPALFFQDLRQGYDATLLGRPAPQVTIGGDTHLGNFGVLRGPKGKPVFGLNDFDQSGKGSPEGDLKRLATSVVLTARAMGLSPARQRELAEKVATSYADALGKGEHGGYVRLSHASGIVEELIEEGSDTKRKDLLDEWSKDGRFRELDNLERLPPAKETEVREAIAGWGHALGADTTISKPVTVLDVVRRLGAGGSTLGMDRYYALIDAKDGKKPRLIELKQFPPSAVDGSSSDLSQADPHQVILNAQKLSGFRNPLMGEAKLGDQKLLVREVEPEKVRLDPEALHKSDLEGVIEQAAQVLAHSHGHATELKRWIGDDAEGLAKGLGDFAVRYANQVRQDFVALKAS